MDAEQHLRRYVADLTWQLAITLGDRDQARERVEQLERRVAAAEAEIAMLYRDTTPEAPP